MRKKSLHNNGPREEALRQQIVGLLPRFRRFARGLTRDPDRADDLIQSACERALERLDQYRERSRIDSWMYRIIYTRWIDEVRKDKTRTANLVVLGNDDNFKSDAGQAGTRLTRSLDIHRALETLSEEHRAAIMLVSVEGYSYTEASTVLNVPVGTVASRVARARTLLGKLLARRPHRRSQPSRQAKGEK